jgi:hypothetical protein
MNLYLVGYISYTICFNAQSEGVNQKSTKTVHRLPSEHLLFDNQFLLKTILIYI